MSEPKTKMTLLLTAPERARLDALRLARGDRSAAATIRALVRDAGGDSPRAPAPGPSAREAIGPCRGCGAPIGEPCRRSCPDRAVLQSLGVSRGWVAQHQEADARRMRDIQQATAPAPAPRRRSENTLGLIDLAPGAVLPDPPRAPRRPAPDPLDTAEDDADAYALLILEEARRSAPAALVAELGDRLPQHPADAVAALIVQALPRGGDPPDPLRPAHVRGAARAARELADALDQLAERA